MKNFRFTQVIIMVILAVAALLVASPPFLRMVLQYQGPDLDDYRIFSNRTVIAGNFQPWDENPALASRRLPEEYVQQIEKHGTVAFLVASKGEISFEKYWNDYSENSLTNSFGMAKSIVGILVGIAIDKGYIHSVDDPIGAYLPEFRKSGKSNITIRHLLEMSSGLDWNDSFSNPFSMSAKAYYGSDLKELVLNLDPAISPGEFYDDKICNTQLLALVLESSTGNSLSTFASQRLWKPIGAQNDAFWSIDQEKGIEKAFCCFSSNARDFARLGQLILQNGKWNGEQIVSSGFIQAAMESASHLKNEHGDLVDYFGWHLWLLNHKGMQVIYMKGLNGQYVLVIPSKDLVIVRLGEKASKESQDNTPIDVFTYLDAGLKLSEAR